MPAESNFNVEMSPDKLQQDDIQNSAINSMQSAIECGIIRGKSKKQRKDIPKTISNGAFVFKNVFRQEELLSQASKI